MAVKKSWYYWLISLSVGMLLLLGTWWLFLVFKLANKLTEFNHPSIQGNLISMIKWEGVSFLTFLFFVGGALIYVYIQDLKKTRALQDFFASLTHELKTPLASMKLQSQVLADGIDQLELAADVKQHLMTYTQRLASDSIKLEDQLDNHLQLSRVERDSPLNLHAVNLVHFIHQEQKRFEELPPIQMTNSDQEVLVLADDYALQTIFRNLFENSLTHHPKLEKISISFQDRPDAIILTYQDYGLPFLGESEKLGELFYKYSSPKGSGIGLYLIKRLLKKMHGKLLIKNDERLVFELLLKKASA